MLYLHRSHWQTIVAEIDKWLLEEACGLVAGLDQTSQAVFPVTNILHSPVRYRMDPEQQLHIFNLIDDNEWQLLAIYHSHPGGPSEPSRIDIAEAAYPGVIHLICFPSDGGWDCRGYLIEQGMVTEVPVEVIDGDGKP